MLHVSLILRCHTHATAAKHEVTALSIDRKSLISMPSFLFSVSWIALFSVMDSAVVHSRVDEYDEHNPHNVGLKQDEHHHDHEKKSVLKKVKAKAKKIKDTIKKHGHHDHDHDHEYHHDEDEQMVEDPEVHGAPIYESSVARSVIPGEEEPHQESKVVVVSPNIETCENRTNDSARARTFVGEMENAGQRKVNLQRPIGLEEDPDAPGTTLEAHAASNYQCNVTDPTGAENQKRQDLMKPSPSPSATSKAITEPSVYLEDMEEIKRVFSRFDINGDGKISVSELDNVLKTVGSGVSQSQLNLVMEDLDKDNDGFINMSEFADFYRSNAVGGDSAELRDAFNLYDQDKNGLIFATELHHVLNRLGLMCSVEECQKMIKSVNAGGDGSVNFEEFKKMMTNKSLSASANP